MSKPNSPCSLRRCKRRRQGVLLIRRTMLTHMDSMAITFTSMQMAYSGQLTQDLNTVQQ